MKDAGTGTTGKVMKKVTASKCFRVTQQEKEFFEGLVDILGFRTERALLCDLTILGVAISCDIIQQAIETEERDAEKYAKLISRDSPKQLVDLAEKNKDLLKTHKDMAKSIADLGASNINLFTDSPLYSFYNKQKDDIHAVREKRV